MQSDGLLVGAGHVIKKTVVLKAGLGLGSLSKSVTPLFVKMHRWRALKNRRMPLQSNHLVIDLV